MNSLRSNKGMTLIEIIVSLMIASIIMVMAGSILLSSLGFFDQHAISDIDKSALDSAIDSMAEQIEYADDLIISTTSMADDDNYMDWNYYRSNQGRLYARFSSFQGVENDLYSDEFYHNRKLVMKVQRKDVDKLYLSMELKENDEVVYERNRTLTLINIKNAIKLQDSTGIEAPDDNIHENSYVYYMKNEIIDNEPEKPVIPSVVGGTVEDELLCMEKNPSIDRGEFSAPNQYKKGDIVSYHGYYYRAQKTTNVYTGIIGPDVLSDWKRLDSFWHLLSEYQKGDIIIYGSDQFGNHQYYQSQKNNNKSHIPNISEKYWLKIDKEDLPKEEVCQI